MKSFVTSKAFGTAVLFALAVVTGYLLFGGHVQPDARLFVEATFIISLLAFLTLFAKAWSGYVSGQMTRSARQLVDRLQERNEHGEQRSRVEQTSQHDRRPEYAGRPDYANHRSTNDRF